MFCRNKENFANMKEKNYVGKRFLKIKKNEMSFYFGFDR